MLLPFIENVNALVLALSLCTYWSVRVWGVGADAAKNGKSSARCVTRREDHDGTPGGGAQLSPPPAAAGRLCLLLLLLRVAYVLGFAFDFTRCLCHSTKYTFGNVSKSFKHASNILDESINKYINIPHKCFDHASQILNNLSSMPGKSFTNPHNML